MIRHRCPPLANAFLAATSTTLCPERAPFERVLARQYGSDRSDLLAFQGEITSRIALAPGVELRRLADFPKRPDYWLKTRMLMAMRVIEAIG
jgi:hypothetical protein